MATKSGTTNSRAAEFVNKSHQVRRGEQAPGRNKQPSRMGTDSQEKRTDPIIKGTLKGPFAAGD